MRTVYDLYPAIEDLRKREYFPDLRDDAFWRVMDECRSSTLINVDAMWNIWESVRSISGSNLPGSFVECGVFLGGSVRAALTFLGLMGDFARRFYLFDTFEGFPEKTEETDTHGQIVKFAKHEDFEDVVRQTVSHAEYPQHLLKFVRGPVESTLRDTANVPDQIAYLRLDTDYYESTRVELEVLYPKVVSGGVCIVDDYGVFDGARRATEEFLDTLSPRPLLHRVNWGVRAFVKP